ncbi:MAG TPA: hypothetical protein VE964_02820 [Myxococcales bacterium]|nr:hypothetical protein [Myxococcales bacterium]
MSVQRALLAAVALSACHTGSSNTVAGATSMGAAAIGVAALERANGGCIALCTAGTTCNPVKGLCEPFPCRGECGSNEHCEQTFSGSKCVAGGPTSVEALVKAKGPVTPEIAPVQAPPKDGSPTIIPAAQQQQNLPQ